LMMTTTNINGWENPPFEFDKIKEEWPTLSENENGKRVRELMFSRNTVQHTSLKYLNIGNS